MKYLDNLSKNDKQLVKDLADEIAQLPPLDVPEVVQFISLIGDEFFKEKLRWFAIGTHIQKSLLGIADPAQNFNLDEELKVQIRADSSYYVALSIVISQAEAFIKTEAHSQGIEYPFFNKLELLLTLVVEESVDRLRSRVPQNEWVSPSGKQLRDMARDNKKWLNGDISDKLFLRRLSKRMEEDQKNLNSHIFAQKPAYLNGIRWGEFCGDILSRYKKNLPGFLNYSDAMMARLEPRLPLAQKFAFINGQIHIYPGRGKSKKK